MTLKGHNHLYTFEHSIVSSLVISVLPPLVVPFLACLAFLRKPLFSSEDANGAVQVIKVQKVFGVNISP